MSSHSRIYAMRGSIVHLVHGHPVLSVPGSPSLSGMPYLTVRPLSLVIAVNPSATASSSLISCRRSTRISVISRMILDAHLGIWMDARQRPGGERSQSARNTAASWLYGSSFRITCWTSMLRAYAVRGTIANVSRTHSRLPGWP